jgi:hypothetical protein
MQSYATHGEPAGETLRAFVKSVGADLDATGLRRTCADEADIVLNLIDHDEPRPFRRRAGGTYVAALHERAAAPGLLAEYRLLVNGLANLVCCYVPGAGVWFTTMDLDHFLVAGNGDASSIQASFAMRNASASGRPQV